MKKGTTQLLALAAVGGAAWYFFFRKPADPMLTITIPGTQGQGQISLSGACDAAWRLRTANNPDWQIWAKICQDNGGTV
jgi:hypothetical protein